MHGSSMAPNWTHAEIPGITVYDLPVIIAPSVFNYYKFIFTVQMNVLSYLTQYKSKDLLCLHENKKNIKYFNGACIGWWRFTVLTW